MNNLCKHCGAQLERNVSTCPSCHKKVELTSEFSKDKPLDEIKKNLLEMSSKAVSMAKVVGAELANETKQINEARKQAKESDEFRGAENKKAAYQNAVKIFWQKLTKKQKAIVAGIPVLIVIFLMIAFEDKKSSSSTRPNSTTQRWTDDQEVVTRAMVLLFHQKAGVRLPTDMFNCNIRGLKKYYAAGDVMRAIERSESRALEIVDKCASNVNSYSN